MGLQQYFDGLLKKKGYLDIMTACFISLVAAGALMPRSWSGINDFVYQLQKIDLTKMGKTKFDLVIIDYAKDNGQPFTAKEIFDLKNSRGGKKMVLAYMSIGEAESYRDFYWNEDWVEGRTTGEPTQKASEWLGSENQEWSGNYKVKYWEQAWQDIIFGHSTSYLDRIMKAGFDGVYLDIIDAYEYWGPGGESG